MFKRSTLKNNAKQTLKKSYWTAFLACLIVSLVISFLAGLGASFTMPGIPVFDIGRTVQENAQDAAPTESLTETDALTETIAELEELTGTQLITPSEEQEQSIDEPPIVIDTDPSENSQTEEQISFDEALKRAMDEYEQMPEKVAQDVKDHPVKYGASALFTFLLTLLIAGILPVCLARFFLESREKEADLGNLFWGFKNSYGRNVLTTFLMRLFISLWSLLFVIPGIVKKYQYSMIPYLLAENPEMSRKRAFELTKSMTKGYKWNLFVLNLSFIGWYILSFIVCCGLPLFFLAPYYQATWAEAYTFLKARALEKGLATEEDFPGFVEKTETSEIPAEVEE